MKVTVVMTLDINPAAWTTEYNVPRVHVPSDVREYFTTTDALDGIRQVAEETHLFGPLPKITRVMLRGPNGYIWQEARWPS